MTIQLKILEVASMIDDLVREHPEKYFAWVKEYYATHPYPTNRKAQEAYNVALEKFLLDRYFLSQNITQLLPPYKGGA